MWRALGAGVEERVRASRRHVSHVPLHVQGQVIAARESSLASPTLERPVSCVFPEVTSEFV